MTRAFGLSRIEEDGRLTYEMLLELLDPELVKMQFQMSAMRTVGDPVMYFNKYPARFVSMHLQGVDLETPLPVSGWGSAAVGNNSLDCRKSFRPRSQEMLGRVVEFTVGSDGSPGQRGFFRNARQQGQHFPRG